MQLEEILDSHSKSAAILRLTQELDDSDPLYEDLFNYYCNNGEMPYGIAKARDGDPYPWVIDQVLRDMNVA